MVVHESDIGTLAFQIALIKLVVSPDNTGSNSFSQLSLYTCRLSTIAINALQIKPVSKSTLRR